jgi:CRP/FNR family transcriptional regulator
MPLATRAISQSVPSAYLTRSTATASRLARPAPRDEGADAVATLERIGLTRTLRRGQELFAEGDAADHYFKVLTGALLSYRLLPDGRRHVQDFHVAGEYLGFTSLPSYPFAAEAMSDCTVVRYPRRAVETLIDEHPIVGRDLLAVVSRELSAAQDRLLLLGRKTALERLASFLLLLGRRTGAAPAAQQTIQLFMTRADIADHLGLTMETVSRGLGKLKRLGAIDLPSPMSVVIRDLGILLQLEQGSGEAGL